MNTTLVPALPAGGSFTPGLHPSPEPTPQPAGHAFGGSRRKHAALAILSALIALVMFAALAFHGYVAWYIAHPYVAPITSNPKAAAGLDYQDVSFPSKSGRTTVHGWYIPSAAKAAGHPGKTVTISAANHDGSGTAVAKAAGSSVKTVTVSAGSRPGTAVKAAASAALSRTVVFSHGYGANREESWVPMYELAALLHRLHYNVLMFDYGYASEADRFPATGGVEESQQLLAAVHYARSKGADQVIVWGFSMGAGTAPQAALQAGATDQIDAMILDSLFLPSPEAMYNNVKQHLDLPRFPSLPLIEWMLPFWTGIHLNQIPAQQVLHTAYSIPLFIMHGTDDSKAPIATAEHIAAEQHNPLSREWIVQDGKHELLFQTRPKEYVQRAALFLSQVDAARMTAGLTT